MGYLWGKASDTITGPFFKNHPILIDWETEHWYLSNKTTQKRKKAFSKITGISKDKKFHIYYTPLKREKK